MKGNFFEQFKNYLLNENEEQLHTYIPYYETLLQIKDDIKELIDDSEKYYLEIRYEKDKHDGYTDGEFEFHFYTKNPNEDCGWHSRINHHYKMELLHDERMWGYCECKPEYTGYNPIHDCCGNGCDWYAPQLHITKIGTIAYHSFDGVQRDMWELENKWNDKKIDHEEEKRLAHLEHIDRKIKELEEQKQQYIK